MLGVLLRTRHCGRKDTMHLQRAMVAGRWSILLMAAYFKGTKQSGLLLGLVVAVCVKKLKPGANRGEILAGIDELQ